MNKPNKCKNCQWYGKPYWSIINPCDSCPMENVETFTQWIDPTIEEKDKEIERLRKREKKWEKWTTEKEILSTKMSEYLCKWKNIKREYNNQVESNRLKKQEIERLSKEITKLNEENKTLKELEKHTMREITRLNNIINELEKDLEEIFNKMKEKQVEISGRGYYYTDLIPIEDILNKLKEGKEWK